MFSGLIPMFMLLVETMRATSVMTVPVHLRAGNGTTIARITVKTNADDSWLTFVGHIRDGLQISCVRCVQFLEISLSLWQGH